MSASPARFPGLFLICTIQLNMKKNILPAYTLFLLCTCLFTLLCSAQPNDTLYKLYKTKQFTQLEQLNNNSQNPLYHFYRAVYLNACNQPAASNRQLDNLLQGKKIPPENISFEYWKLRGDNYVRLFDYKNAAAVENRLLKNFRGKYDSTNYQGEFNATKIWESLSNEKAQTIVQPATSIIPLTHDLAGLINIKVNSSGTDTNFVFDTGAGMSSITESLAQKLNFRFMPDTGIRVSGFNNISNAVRIAIADELKIGDIIISNEPFLVFKDEALSFAGGAYKINGIIGFPVAKGLGSIAITKDHLEIGSPAIVKAPAQKNLFVEELRPVLILTYKGKRIPFNFDTGANASQFSKTFFDEYGAELEKTGRIETSRYASAGGAVELKALVVPNVKFELGEEEIIFPEIKIDMENYHVSGNELYGNIGQDLLKRYKKVTISFTGNYLKLEN